jgi:hypothetical protein
LNKIKITSIGKKGGFNELQIDSQFVSCWLYIAVHHSELCRRRNPISILVNPDVPIPADFLPIDHRGYHWLVPAWVSQTTQREI